MERSGEQTGKAPQVFATTHWSMVTAAGDPASPRCREALEHLCATYWYPLYAYARRCNETPESAQDLTQGFFASLFERDAFAVADRSRGKFRWFLLASFKHFLANEWARARALKRGGGKAPVALDGLAAEERYRIEPSHGLTPDVLYERRWALTLLDRAREGLGEEFAARGKADRFSLLEQYLPGGQPELPYSEAARELGMSEGGIKAEVHRMKKRFGELLRAEVAQTVADPAEIDDEIRHLIDALFRRQ